MKLHHHVLSALVLSFALPVLAPGSVGTAKAEGGRRIYFDAGLTGQNYLTWKPRVVISSGDDDVGSVTVELESERGEEEVPLVASDTWLHGSAKIVALPAVDAALTVTVYDTSSAALISFSGTLGADGSITLEADATATTGACTSRLGCGEEGTRADAPDIEVLAAELFAVGSDGGSYDLSVDLAGADTFDVAYASVTVTEPGTQTCIATDEKGNCLKWGTTEEVSTRAEVFWDDVGTVWEAEATLAHTGVIDMRAKVLDLEGNTLENVKAELGEPWVDDGGGVNALSAGAGTSVALTHFVSDAFASGHVRTPRMTVVSDGWSATSYPTHAELELAGGGAVLVPANSYQRKGDLLAIGDVGRDARFRISGGNTLLFELSLSDLGSPVCADGLCATLVGDASGGYGLAFTTYGTHPASLKDARSVVVDELIDDVVAEERVIVFDDAITAVFATELEIDGDPLGGDASGSVSLLGAAERNGRQATLSKGTFYGSFSRDSEGDLSLGGYGADDWATSDTSADVLLGDPVECGGAGCDGDWGPPVLAFGTGGRITKIVVSSGGLGY